MLETEKKEINLYELLDAIEARPALYIGSKSLRLLEAFLAGVIFAAIQDERFPVHSIDFNNWVALRLRFFESTTGYANMIVESECGDEESSVDRFFELWREFRVRKSRVIYEIESSTDRVIVSQQRSDTGEIEEMPSDLIQIIKYTDDDSGFIKFVNNHGEIQEFYVYEFGEIFWWVEALGFKAPETSWVKVGD